MTDKPFSPEEHFRVSPCSTHCTIEKYVGPGGDVVIPEEIGGLTVRGLLDIAGPWVSPFCEKPVTSVTLPRTITHLGEEAFSCCSTLREVFIPATLETMGSNPFTDCDALTTFHVAEDNPVFCAIDGALYLRDPLTLVAWPAGRGVDVVIPEGVEGIGDRAFYMQRELRSIQLPESLRNIGSAAFEECSALTALRIPDSFVCIDDCAFRDCIALTALDLGKGVSCIGSEAFAGCEALTSVHVPDSVTQLCPDAFDDCPALTDISLPGGVILSLSWGYPVVDCPPVFFSEHLLEPVTLNNITPVYRPLRDDLCFIGGALCRRDPMTLLLFPPNESGEAIVPEGVQIIGESAFCNFRHVRSVVLPDSVTTIAANAFHSCREMTSIRLSARLTSIGENAFRSCEALTAIRLPEGLTVIGESAFRGCKALTAVRIPGSVRTIDVSAFQDCTALVRVHVFPGVRNIWDDAFRGCTALERIIMPCSVRHLGQLLCDGCEKVTFCVPVSSRALHYASKNGHRFRVL